MTELNCRHETTDPCRPVGLWRIGIRFAQVFVIAYKGKVRIETAQSEFRIIAMDKHRLLFVLQGACSTQQGAVRAVQHDRDPV